MITSQQVADAFNAAGIDTLEKLAAAVNGFATQLEIGKIDIQLHELSSKAQEAIAPINNKRIELQNRRNELTEAIKPAEIKA